MASPARSGIRMSAEERRGAVIAAAVIEFARGGLDGTSTEAIAVRAGISQPYLFRLFPTKQALFLAAVRRGFERVIETFELASKGLAGEEALDAMGAAYLALITDNDLLLLQLHSYAASSNAEIRTAVSACYTQLAEFVADRTGAGPDELRPFFAMGMLCNVVAALGLQDVQELWNEVDCAPDMRFAVGPPDLRPVDTGNRPAG